MERAYAERKRAKTKKSTLKQETGKFFLSPLWDVQFLIVCFAIFSYSFLSFPPAKMGKHPA
jgi:hypothetical protein